MARLGPKFFLLATVLVSTACTNVEQPTMQADQSKIINYESIDYTKAAKYNLQLGMGYLQQGDVERAKGKFLRAIDQAPYLPEAHYNIAHFYYLIDEQNQADKHFQQALYYSKNDLTGVAGTAHNNYGVFLCQTKRYVDAYEQFNLAINDSKYADTASAYENAGLCALKQGNKQQAKQYFDKALKQNPLSEKALLERAELYLNDKEYDNARTFISRYETLSRTTKRTLLLKLKLAKLLGDAQQISEITADVISKYPEMRDKLEHTTISQVEKTLYNNKLVKYTEIGELKRIT